MYGYKSPIGISQGVSTPCSLTSGTEDQDRRSEVTEEVLPDVTLTRTSLMEIVDSPEPPSVQVVPDSVPESSLAENPGSGEVESIQVVERLRRREGVRQFFKTLPFRR